MGSGQEVLILWGSVGRKRDFLRNCPPALFCDGCMLSKLSKSQFRLIRPNRIPDDHTAQETKLFFTGPTARQVDHLIGQDVAFGGGKHRFGCPNGVLFESGDKKDVALGKAVKKCEICIGPINGDDRAFGPVEGSSYPDLMSLAPGDDPIAGQASIVIEQQMQLDRSFGTAKLCPVEHLQTEIDHRRIQAKKLVLETKGLRGGDSLTTSKQLYEDLLEELPWPVGIGVGEGRAFRGISNSKVVELSLDAGQTSTNLKAWSLRLAARRLCALPS
jgi:hypothetical protein